MGQIPEYPGLEADHRMVAVEIVFNQRAGRTVIWAAKFVLLCIYFRVVGDIRAYKIPGWIVLGLSVAVGLSALPPNGVLGLC